MPVMAQGAHRGRPVAAAPCTPGLRPATSPLRGAFDLSLQASGRAEAASVQNTALSPHPCGLPRPSGNVSAILRPSAPAVSATMVNKLTAGRTNRMPGLRYRSLREDAVGRISVAPSGTKTGTVSAVSCPAALHLPGRRYRGLREAPVGRISVAPSGIKAGMAPVVSSPAALRLPGLGYMGLRGAGDNVIGMQLY